MKRIACIAAVGLLVFGGLALAQDEHGHAAGHAQAAGHSHGAEGAKSVTLVGEVLDLTCYMQHPDNAVGPDHAKCAKACINKGLPIGFLGEDGTMYLLIGTGHDPIASKVAEVVGKKVTIKGSVVSQHGMKAVQLASVEP